MITASNLKSAAVILSMPLENSISELANLVKKASGNARRLT